MFNSRPSTAIGRTCWGLLLGLVLALRLLVPAGYMPAWDKGQPAIVACADFAVSTNGHGDPDHDNGRDEQPCAYALAAAMAVDRFPLLAEGQVEFDITVDADWTSSTPSIGQGLAAPPPPSRGPPLA
jgi:hypothetical protein